MYSDRQGLLDDCYHPDGPDTVETVQEDELPLKLLYESESTGYAEVDGNIMVLYRPEISGEHGDCLFNTLIAMRNNGMT